MNKKAALIVGARPQFIKTAPLVVELGRFFNLMLIHTGQHYDFVMSGSFFDELELPEPDYHLGVSWNSAGKQTGRMIEALDQVLSYEKPEIVIVVGDTNSTLAGAISASKLRIPVVHVEAGVRSNDKYLPEQINRVVTDSVSDCFLCPTPSSVENLKSEGKTENLFFTGDILYDSVRFIEDKIDNQIKSKFDLANEFALVTIHRAEVVDNKDNLQTLLKSLSSINISALFPMHPRTRKMIDHFKLSDSIPENIKIIDPIGYLDMLSLIKYSKSVITDSGGVQREAAYFSTPVYLARSETEWIELVDLGAINVMDYDFEMSDKLSDKTINHDAMKYLFKSAGKNMAESVNEVYG